MSSAPALRATFMARVGYFHSDDAKSLFLWYPFCSHMALCVLRMAQVPHTLSPSSSCPASIRSWLQTSRGTWGVSELDVTILTPSGLGFRGAPHSSFWTPFWFQGYFPRISHHSCSPWPSLLLHSIQAAQPKLMLMLAFVWS